MLYTVAGRYNAVQFCKILHKQLQELKQNINQMLHPKGELWTVFCEYLWENRPRYNGTWLYVVIMKHSSAVPTHKLDSDFVLNVSADAFAILVLTSADLMMTTELEIIWSKLFIYKRFQICLHLSDISYKTLAHCINKLLIRKKWTKRSSVSMCMNRPMIYSGGVIYTLLLW